VQPCTLQLKRERIYRLSNEHAEYTEMMLLLEQIDQIRKVPEKVDDLLRHQCHVEGAELLVDTTDAIEGEVNPPRTPSTLILPRLNFSLAPLTLPRIFSPPRHSGKSSRCTISCGN
jgi:hypothetical protein